MSENKSHEKDRVIDMSAKKTEDEWAYFMQALFEKIVPSWFKLLGWILATGSVAYLVKKTGSLPLLIIEALSYGMLIGYFSYFFASVRLEPYDSWIRSRSSKLKIFLALQPRFVLTGVLILGIRVLSGHVIEQVQIAK